MNLSDEIRKQIEKNKGLKLAVGEINNNLSILEELVRKDIEERKNEAYQKGYDAGIIASSFVDKSDEAYQRGLEDGKAVSDKGCVGCKWEGNGKDHSPCDYCCNCYSSQWAAKQTDEEIKVGDEVYCKGDDTSDSGVVTWVGKKRVCAMWQDGSAG